MKAALKHEGIKIVSYDWLEDSLHHRKCRAVRKYLWEKIEKEGKVQKRARKKVKKEKVEQAGEFCSPPCPLFPLDMCMERFYLDGFFVFVEGRTMGRTCSL